MSSSRRIAIQPSKRRVALLGVAVAALLVVAACGSSTPASSGTTGSTPATGSTETGGGAGAQGGPVVNLYQADNYAKYSVEECNKESAGKYTLKWNQLPTSADDQYSQLTRQLGGGDTSVDIMALDVTWTAAFANAGWIEDLSQYKSDLTNGVLPGPVESATYQGKLWAAPLFTNVQLMWYRKDLVPTAPKTWDDVFADAQKLKDEGKTYAIAATGAQYEGLTVLLNDFVASAGGQILNSDGTQADLDAGAKTGLETLGKLANSGLADPGFANAQEGQVLAAFQNGKAAFMYNWPYVYASLQSAAPDIFKDLAWTTPPSLGSGDMGKATVGGINLAINAKSQHPDAALAAVKCLTSPKMQLFAAIVGGVPPVTESVYSDTTPVVNPTDGKSQTMTDAYPMGADILAALKNSVSRPVTPNYNAFSTAVQQTISPPTKINDGTADALTKAINSALNS